MRIISTVPSQTELLYDLGLQEQVIGITKFCVHPEEWFRTKARIGGTKNLNLVKILSLKPDLIISNREENVKEQIESLGKHAEVFVSDIKTIEDNIKLISQLGALTHTESKAIQLQNEFKTSISRVNKLKGLKVAYLIWKDPLMVAGGDTFINTMLEFVGCENVFKNQMRYPETNIEELTEKKPDVLLLSSEPFPFKQKHIDQFKNDISDIHCELVDGEAFSWYGTRIMKKVDYLNGLVTQLS